MSDSGLSSVDGATDLDSLREALSAAKAETEAVRAKLHNAVRKGKTIDAERKKAVGELSDLAKELANAQEQLTEVQSSTAALHEQDGDLSSELQAACARAAALDEKLKQVQAESAENVRAIELKHQAAEEALRQQIDMLQAAASQQALPTQDTSEALQKATARAQEAESLVAELRQEAEVMNEALQVRKSLPCLPLAHPVLGESTGQ